MRIALVAGEASGDILGAGLIEALAERLPSVRFEGVAGPRMVAAGCEPVFRAERLAVMGLSEILRRYRELRGLREGLRRRYLDDPPDCFVAIDAPDFNLDIECSLRRAGIPTVHYVSPSVWAWREYRLARIARAVDLMLTLFPFEADYYRERGVPVSFVGHPLADTLVPVEDPSPCRTALGLPDDRRIVAILPGSRLSEVRQLARPFLETAAWCLERRNDLHFIVPMASESVREAFAGELESFPARLPMTLVDGRSQEAMAASDVVLLASGTAALEGLLIGRPMVAAYRMARASYWFARALLRIDRYTLPNLLAGERLVPEFIQEDVVPAAMGEALLGYLDAPDRVAELRRRFAGIGRELRRDASRRASVAITGMLAARGLPVADAD